MDSLNYHALSLTEQAREVLKGELSVWLRPLKRAKANPTAKPQTEWLRTEREERLWQALRAWRIQQAQALNVPAYVIFHDRTLQSIVQTVPQTLADLGQIYGLGEAKAQKYGADIVAICTEHSRLEV